MINVITGDLGEKMQVDHFLRETCGGIYLVRAQNCPSSPSRNGLEMENWKSQRNS